MKRKQLSKKDIKDLNAKIETDFGISDCIDKKANAELVDDKFISIDNEIKFFYSENKEKIIPTLKSILQDNFLKKITVDMGAVKFVTGGADIMRPGIVKIEEGISEGQIICIVDETHGKPLAIGEAVFSSEEMQAKDSGKVIKNLHYVGDDVWKI